MPKQNETREVRALTGNVELRSAKDGSRTLAGTAVVYGALSDDLGGFREKIKAGAFTQSLRQDDQLVLFGHDPNKVLGRKSAGTATFSDSSSGLSYSCRLGSNSVATDTIDMISRGDISQNSFGFSVIEDEWSVDSRGCPLRTVTKAVLHEVSPVAFPAYPSGQNTVNLRAALKNAPAEIRSKFALDDDGYEDERDDLIGDEPDAGQGDEYCSACNRCDRCIRCASCEEREASFGDDGQRHHKHHKHHTPHNSADSETRRKQFVSSLSTQKWAILPETLETICTLLNVRATPDEICSAVDPQHSVTPSGNGFAVIPVHGVIGQRSSDWGGTSCESISRQIRAALADYGTHTIVLDIDSPGGTVNGVPELASEILKARDQKPVIAVANGMAASAAYWIASAATRIVCTPSSEVGSIGVYTTHTDYSSAMAKDGVKVTFVQAGKHKTEGNPYEPLSADAKSDMQDGVNKFYDMFTQSVASGRDVTLSKVLSDFGQGRMLMAQDALRAGMVDEIGTLDSVLGPSSQRSKRSAGNGSQNDNRKQALLLDLLRRRMS